MTTEERQGENTEHPQATRLITERDLAELCQQYGRYLQRFFLSHGTPSADVQDLVQDTFTVIWARRGEYDPQKARSFLHGTARNILLAHNRKHYCRKGIRDKEIEAITQNVHPKSAHQGALGPPRLDHELLKQLDHAIKNLPYSLREILRLRYIEGRTLNEVAQAMSVPLSTIHRREKLALGRLREELGDTNLK